MNIRCGMEDKDCVENIIKQLWELRGQHREPYEIFRQILRYGDISVHQSSWEHTCQPERSKREDSSNGDAVL